MTDSNQKDLRSAYLTDVTEEIRAFANLPVILERMDDQRVFADIALLFDRVFGQEIHFTVQRRLSRTQAVAARFEPLAPRVGALPQQQQLQAQPGSHHFGHQ